jgi:hypothetical protein
MRSIWSVAGWVVLGAFGAALAWGVYEFGVMSAWWQPVWRPHGVTKSARFVYNLKGSFWFDCSVDVQLNVNRCKAWDSRGQLVADGEFQLEKEARAATASELHPTTIGSIGPSGLAEEIFLLGPRREAFGMRLVLVDKGSNSR